MDIRAGPSYVISQSVEELWDWKTIVMLAMLTPASLRSLRWTALPPRSGMEGLAQTAPKLFAGVVIICLCSFVDRGEFLFERTKRKGSKLVNKPEHRGLVVRKKTEGSTLANQGSNNRNLICGARNEGRWKRERRASQCVECRAHRRCRRQMTKNIEKFGVSSLQGLQCQICCNSNWLVSFSLDI
jgi:hypothetical protein